MLATGSKTDANRAATHTVCRCDAGPFRMNQVMSSATAVTSADCQRELRRNVSATRLIVSIGFLFRFFEQLANLLQFLGYQMTSFHKVHHQTVGRTSKEAIDHIAD